MARLELRPGLVWGPGPPTLRRATSAAALASARCEQHELLGVGTSLVTPGGELSDLHVVNVASEAGSDNRFRRYLCARRRRTRRTYEVTETSCSASAGDGPARQGVASQPVPSVAWSAAMLAAKRTQGARSHAMEPRKEKRPSLCGSVVGVVDGKYRRRRCRRLAMREAEIQPGSKSIGARAWGHPETWEASSFSPNTRDGPPADQVLALRRAHDAASEQRANGDTADRRKRSEAGRATRRRSSP